MSNLNSSVRAVLFRCFHNPSNSDAYCRIFNVLKALLGELQFVLTTVKLSHLLILIRAILGELHLALAALFRGATDRTHSTFRRVTDRTHSAYRRTTDRCHSVYRRTSDRCHIAYRRTTDRCHSVNRRTTERATDCAHGAFRQAVTCSSSQPLTPPFPTPLPWSTYCPTCFRSPAPRTLRTELWR